MIKSEKPTIFISYSHKDERPWKDFVVDHLRVAERQGDFAVWDDRRIQGGGEWRADIDVALEHADIAVLLVSRHFLTSNFIMDHEVQALLRRRKEQGLLVYPILISACTWQSVDWLAQLNVRPTDGNPLNSFDDAERDLVMTALADEIGRLVYPAHDAADADGINDTSSTDSLPRSHIRFGAFDWWRSAGIGLRATVLGTAFGGLALLWGITSTFLSNTPDCDVSAENNSVAVCGDVQGNIGAGVRPVDNGAAQ